MPDNPADKHSRYSVDAVLRACDLLEALGCEPEPVRLKHLVLRTQMNKTTAFRILSTLASRGLVERVGNHQYRSMLKPLPRNRYRVGYCSLSSDFQFSRDITEGLTRAAAEERVDLIALDNRYNARLAVRNADLLIKERVDLAMEHQGDERIAPVIAARFNEANIPMIAIHVPHPGANYYGPDNYTAGLKGGRYLGRWAKQHWKEVSDVILLEYPRAGVFVRSRLTGTLVGIKEALPHIPDSRVAFLNGGAQFGQSLQAVRKHLRTKGVHRSLIVGINDPSAIGGLRAFEEAGHSADCAGLGHGGSIEARAELRRPATRMIASVAYFPEKYGEELIALALQILNKRPVPPAMFVKNEVITTATVDHFYPTDALRSQAEMTSLLLSGTS